MRSSSPALAEWTDGGISDVQRMICRTHTNFFNEYMRLHKESHVIVWLMLGCELILMTIFHCNHAEQGFLRAWMIIAKPDRDARNCEVAVA